MASQDVLQHLRETARTAANALDLQQPYYDAEETAGILHISRAKLYRYLNDLGIDTVGFENDRKRYILPEDIRDIYVHLHTPYLQKKEGAKIRPPLPAALPPRVAPSVLPAALRRVELQPIHGRNGK